MPDFRSLFHRHPSSEDKEKSSGAGSKPRKDAPNVQQPRTDTVSSAPRSPHRSPPASISPPAPPAASEVLTSRAEDGAASTSVAEAGSEPETLPPQRVAESATAQPEGPAPRDLWRDAMQKRPEEERKRLQINDLESVPLERQIHELINITKQRQKQCEDKFWKFTIGRHEFILRDYTVKIVDCLQKIGDVAIQFAPPQASTPWAVVKALMQVPVIESAQMWALLASTDRILRIINRGQVYEHVFTAATTEKAAIDNLETVLLQVYGAALELLFNLTKLFAVGTASRTAHAILHPSEVKDLLAKLDELETALDLEVQACQVARSAAADDRLERDVRVATDILRSLDRPLVRIDENVGSLLERVQQDDQLNLLEWISPVPYSKHHTAIKEARTSGTCEWLLQHKSFAEWQDDSFSAILWLQGSPGSGKTFLTSKVVDQVSSLLSTANEEGFAFFYCKRDEENRRNPLSVLQSCVRQLSTPTARSNEMRAMLRRLCHKTRLEGGNLSFAACKQQLLESVNLYPKTTIVLDALDECDPDTRGELVETIDYLLSEARRPLKVFISSRPDGDIRDCFAARPTVAIDATDNHSDIQKYIGEAIIKHRRWNRISKSLRDDIIRTLSDRSGGMFQWVFLQVKQLLKQQTESAIRNQLGKLPEGLKEAYDEIYGEIATRDAHEKTLADRAFMWVMCAVTPLNNDELFDAVRRDGVSTELADEVDEDLLLDICNNLLVLDSQRQVWRFSHLSVQEYFESQHWSLWDAHCLASKVCLVFLIETFKDPISVSKPEHKSSEEPAAKSEEPGGNPTVGQEGDSTPGPEASSPASFGPPRTIENPKHTFQRYVGYNWTSHVQAHEGRTPDPELVRLLKTFLGSHSEGSEQYRVWQKRLSGGWLSETFSIFILLLTGDLSMAQPVAKYPGVPIWTMCQFGFYTPLLDWWQQAEIDISQTNKIGQNLLIAAIDGGCKPICEILVTRGVPVDALMPKGDYGSALAAAAASGLVEIADYLLKQGADVNQLLIAGTYGNALAAAASHGRSDVVKLLVDHGADVTIQLSRGSYGNVVTAAALSSNVAIVEFLVQRGADPNALPLQDEYGSALAAAAAGAVEDTTMLEFLLGQGADVNLRLEGGKYGSALAAAAIHAGDYPTILDFLIKQGAEVNMTLPGQYGSAMIAAATRISSVAIEFLIRRGGDVVGQVDSGKFGSALIAAAAESNESTLELLIKHGADVSAQIPHGEFGSPLVAVAASSYVGKMEVIIKNGADVNAAVPYGQYGLPVIAAATRVSFYEPLQCLLDHGADVNAQTAFGDYGYAIVAAAAKSDLGMIKLLVKHGADVNAVAPCGTHGTPLAAARKRDSADIVKYLIQHGAVEAS